MNALRWGLFCACSWTWCIGMYLPRVMLDKYGWAGFWVFFIPNVIGCAALGYVMRSRDASERYIDRHRNMALLFSSVTIAFHAFFAVKLAASITPASGTSIDAWADMAPPIRSLIAIGILAVGAFVISKLRGAAIHAAVAIVWLTSLGLLVWLAKDGDTRAAAAAVPTIRNATELWLLAPIIAFGFALCPYLDLSFHRAHMAAPKSHAFGIFGLTFAPMLLLTTLIWMRETPHLTLWVFLHLGLQGMLTTGIHLREIHDHAASARSRALLSWCPFVVGLVFLIATLPVDTISDAFRRFLLDDAMYLRFLAPYGMVFPAYVVIFGRRRGLPRTTRNWALFVFACVLLAPIYELGYNQHRAWGMILPAAAAIFAAIVIHRRPIIAVDA